MPLKSKSRSFSHSLAITIAAFSLFQLAIMAAPGLLPQDNDTRLLAAEPPSTNASPPGTVSTEEVGTDPVSFQAKLKKVILESLSRQRIPYKNFVWLTPKPIDNAILALPFSVDVGAQKIVLPVYVINHRYLVTTPLLDISRHYAVVPSIPPPQPIALSLSSTDFDLARFPSTGKKEAPHLVIMFGDEQCAACRRWNRQEEESVRKDPAIRFVYIPYPQVTIHKNALTAAIFEMCAYEAKPSSFWAIHDQIDRRVELKNIDKAGLSPIFSGFMIQAGVPTGPVKHCMDESRPLEAISKAGNTLGERIGVPSPPVFLIDGQVKQGYMTYAQIKQTLSMPKNPVAPSNP